MLIWFFATNGLIKDIRNSKLSTADRILGLFFGIARAFLLVVLFNIMIGWMMPEKTQPKALQESKYFKLAGSFAKPLEEMLPEETLENIREKTRSWGEKEQKAEPESQTQKGSAQKTRRLKNRLDARKTPLNRLLKIPMAITKTKGIISTA